MRTRSNKKRPGRMSNPYIAVQHTGPPRDANAILRDIKDKQLHIGATCYFGCFRFEKTRQPCYYCKLHQLNVLHCLDSWTESCDCENCDQLKHYPEGCEEYPDEWSDAEYYNNNQ